MKNVAMKQAYLIALSLAGSLCTASVASAADAGARFGDVLRFSKLPGVVWAEAATNPAYGKPPLTVECWARLNGKSGFNVLVADEPKESATHWELYTALGSGKFEAYLPGWSPSVISTRKDVVDGQWHYLAMTFDGESVRLSVDGREEACVKIARKGKGQPVAGALTLGKAAAQSDPADVHGCDGEVGEVRLSKIARAITAVPTAPLSDDADTVGLWHFAGARERHDVADASRGGNAMRVRRSEPKSLDEIDRASFKAGPSPMDSPAQEIVLQEGAAEHPAGVTELSLDGAWEMAEGGEATGRLADKWLDAIPAAIPGSVHTALQKAGKIPDPKVGLNDAVARTNSFKVWWFKRTFDRPANLSEGKLVFGGVAIKCTVWLNGRELGSHEGMFGGPEFDVSGLLQKQNTLIVKVFPAPYVVGKGEPNDFFRGMNVGWLYTVVFNNVYGWHYSNIPALGIWRSVRIGGAPKVRLNAPFVATRDAQGGIVDLSCELEGPSQGLSGHVLGTLEPDNFTGKTYHWSSAVAAEQAKTNLHLRFTVPEPHLWWPNDLGEHNLYRLKLSFVPGGGGVSDTRSVTFGLRTIEMAPLPGGPNAHLCNWTFVINRRPQFVKGTGWCTMDSSMDFSRTRYERIVKLASLQHVQMFRAWGSGMPETDDFYDLCNRYGIMVMQEWPTAWDSHKEGWQPYGLLEETVRLNMLRLRNNPSLVMWGGGNESGQPYGKAIDMMGRYSIELDGTRPFHRGEPYGGSTHNYDCDWGQRPLDTALGLTAPFFGEFGMRSMPVYESVQRYLPDSEKNLWPAPDGGSFAYHTPVFNKMQDMVRLRKFAGYFSKGLTMREFCTASQVAATTCVRHTLERARTRWPDCTGALYYKMNDNYPAASWACVDWYGAPKMNHYFFQQAFAPLHTCVLFSTFNLSGKTASAPELVAGRFGKAINVAEKSQEVPITGVLKERPVTFECWVKLNSFAGYNIIMSVAPKEGKHWEIYTAPNTGTVSVFMTGVGDFPSSTPLRAGQWHYLAFRLELKSFELYVDGKKALAHAGTKELVFDEKPLVLGGLSEGGLGCDGAVDELSVNRRTDSLEGAVPNAPAAATGLVTFHFDQSDEIGAKQKSTPTGLSMPVYLLDDADALKDSGSWDVVVRAYDGKLAEIKRQSYKGSGPINRAAKLGEFTITPEQAQAAPLMVVAEVRKNGTLADRTFYWTNFHAVKDSLFNLPTTEVSMKITDGAASLKNTGKIPAVGVNVSRPGHADTFLAEENYFWIDPGETKTVNVSDARGLVLDGWNVEKASPAN